MKAADGSSVYKLKALNKVQGVQEGDARMINNGLSPGQTGLIFVRTACRDWTLYASHSCTTYFYGSFIEAEK
jgi:hypothetical protein